MESAAWGFVGTIAGALASIATTWLSALHTARLQDRKAGEERLERSRAFQTETLLELQEAFHDSLRLIAKAYLEDREGYRLTGVWGDSSLSEEVSEGVCLGMRRVKLLSERVSDDSLRLAVDASMKPLPESFTREAKKKLKRFSTGVC